MFSGSSAVCPPSFSRLGSKSNCDDDATCYHGVSLRPTLTHRSVHPPETMKPPSILEYDPDKKNFASDTSPCDFSPKMSFHSNFSILHQILHFPPSSSINMH